MHPNKPAISGDYPLPTTLLYYPVIEPGVAMAKTKVSATELVWIFRERLKSFRDCSSNTDVAIVPSNNGWTVVTNVRRRDKSPRYAKRIEKLKELRDVYVLAED